MCMDEPEAIISIIEKYSDFRAMYEQIYEICQNIEEVMNMFSKELRELDRNTVQLMIDEMQEELNRERQKAKQRELELNQERQKVGQMNLELKQKNQELEQKEQEYQKALERIAELESSN